jgi:hypothetical protein
MAERFVDSGQGLDNVRIFEIGLAIVIGLDDAKLGDRLTVDVGGEVTEAPCRAHELVLVTARGLTEAAQASQTVLFG